MHELACIKGFMDRKSARGIVQMEVVRKESGTKLKEGITSGKGSFPSDYLTGSLREFQAGGF